MKRKILNILVIFFIVFISTFVNKKVEANCKYYTYSEPVRDGKVLYGAGTGTGTAAVYEGIAIRLDYSKNFLDYNMKFTSPTGLSFSSLSFESEVKNNGCPSFIIVYYDGIGSGFEAKRTNKNSEVFYNGNLIYNPLSSANEDEGYYIDLKKSIKAGVQLYMFKENLEKDDPTFQYKHDVYNELVSNGSENDVKAKLAACDIKYSEGGIALEYYQQTKKNVESDVTKTTKNYGLEDENVDPSYAGLLRVRYMNWYTITSYVMLEYDPEYLLWFYKKIYHSLDDNTDYENCVSFLESLVDVKKIEDKKDKYDDNNKDDGEEKIPICNYYCKNENGDAEKFCRSSDAFNHCKYCYSIPQDAEKNKCLEQYKKQAERNEEELEKELEDNKEKLWKNFSGISAPTLDINFDKHYELTCDDVSFFHWFYVVLRILAPVAVIFFGTLDYAKAVIASDVEKMNKSKKNFPKRLILLILFITIPLIISLLLSIFGGDYSLMDCIINGE